MPRSPEDAEKAADKLKLEGDARTAFVARLSAGYVPPEAPAAPVAPAPPAPKVEVAPAAKVEAKAEPKTTTQSKSKYGALGESSVKGEQKKPTPPPPDGPMLGPVPPPEPATLGPQEPPPFGPVQPPKPAQTKYAALAGPSIRNAPERQRSMPENSMVGQAVRAVESMLPAPSPPSPVGMADVRKADASVYRREAPKDTYFKAMPATTATPNVGESGVGMSPASAPATTDATRRAFEADYGFLLSKGYTREKLDTLLAEQGAVAISDRAAVFRGAK